MHPRQANSFAVVRHTDAIVGETHPERDYFRLAEADLTRKRGRHRQERALAMELLHRYSGLKQRMISERFGRLDEGLVSRDRRAIREKIGTEPKMGHEH
jgi:hypothetical protein